MKKIMVVIRWIWQLPQNLIGFLLTRRYEVKSVRQFKDSTRDVYFKHFFNSAVCLGDYIILDYYLYCGKVCSRQVFAHECGHRRQSLILGWLYLPLVGLPSLLGNIWDRLFHKKWTKEQRAKWYYSRYPERWADVLGGVIRD